MLKLKKHLASSNIFVPLQYQKTKNENLKFEIRNRNLKIEI
jgi:hypothetical protein